MRNEKEKSTGVGDENNTIMLTPIFELSQDNKFVKALIYAPFANVAETEIEFDGKEVLFSSKPYFLRLYLPEEVIENGEESTNYDADTKKFMITMPKKEPSKYFPGLDMITQLLTPPGRTQAKRLVEELAGENEGESKSEEDEEETKWLVEQALPSTSNVINRKDTNGYGFVNQHHSVFSGLREELSEIVDVRTPDDVSIVDRQQLVFEMESSKFSDEHYLADHYSTDEIKRLVDQELFWQQDLPVTFTVDERDRLKNLPKRRIALTDDETALAMAGLVNILFAYAYDYRTTEGEHNVESGWTISKLSSALSCLLSWMDVKQAVVSSIRRSLCYPLYRNWELSVGVLRDVGSIFRQGKPMVLKCLLDIHRIFANDTDYRYVFNDLYIADYSVWIQGVEDSVFATYSDAIDKVSQTISKADVALNLDEVELAASLAMLEVNENGSKATRPRENADQLDSDDDEEVGETC